MMTANLPRYNPEHKPLAIALGGHAIMDPYNPEKNLQTQEAHITKVVNGLIQTVLKLEQQNGYRLQIVGHGSGPQTKIVLDRAELSQDPRLGDDAMHSLDLRYATMDLIGSLGIFIENAIRNAIIEDNKTRPLLVTPTNYIIDPNTMHPVKPIGSPLSPEAAEKKRQQGYVVENKNDGKGERVVVPSPQIERVAPDNLMAISTLIRAGALILAGGAGGVALKKGPDGLTSIEDAVIDKDGAVAALLKDLSTLGIQFHTFTIITDVDSAYQDFKKVLDAKKKIEQQVGQGISLSDPRLRSAFEAAGPINLIGITEMEDRIAEGEENGKISGGAVPKLKAACKAVKEGQVEQAIICSPETLEPALANGQTGTIIVPDKVIAA